MIEGIIILVIVVTVGVAALLALTYWTAITAFFADLTASVIAITTGTATFLTQWFYWAIEPTNYFGWAWISTWALLLAYAAYEIATSDKGWRNAIGRRSNPIALMLCIFLIAQPFIVSYGAIYLSDQTGYTLIDYIPETQHSEFYAAKTNATTTYTSTQTETFDNDTLSCIVAALDFPSVTAATRFSMFWKQNITYAQDYLVSKIVITYTYVGIGNLSTWAIYNAVSPYQNIRAYSTAALEDIDENGTITFYPEPFQQNLIKSLTYLNFALRGLDSSNLGEDNDYIDISIKLYYSSTLFTQAFMMQTLATALAAINVIAFVGLSGLYKKFM